MHYLNLLKLGVFCLALVLARMFKTGEHAFVFLIWNLFLAILPYWFLQVESKTKIIWQKASLLIATVLFLPNAPYLLTDLFHLHKNAEVPMWYDLVLILSFAFLGLFIFVLCTARLFHVLELYVKNRILIFQIKMALFLANGYGIYLGRYLRFNSWDLLSKPDELLKGMMNSVFNWQSLGMTFTFTIFLYLVFGIFQTQLSHGHQQQQRLP